MLESGKDMNVDFTSLAIHDPEFAKIYSGNGHIDFQDPKALQQLTKTLLKQNFNLDIELPDDRLCPPVPVRYEYIRWIQDLLDTTDRCYQGYRPEQTVIGVDIGVGASCIFPLIGCALRPKWRFGGTEIDAKNTACAIKNVALNGLDSRIRIRKMLPTSSIINLDALDLGSADFVMCNPPFFTSREDMYATYETKKRPPSAVCTGAEVEMITKGGDLGFVLRMIDESSRLRKRVQWYSSMLGKLSSVSAVVARLKAIGVTNWAVTCLQAGKVTKRWAFAWSFEDMRPSNEVTRRKITIKDFLPFPTELVVRVGGMSPTIIIEHLSAVLGALDVKWTWDIEQATGLCFAKENVWSRFARRHRSKTDSTQHQSNAVDAHDSGNGAKQHGKDGKNSMDGRMTVEGHAESSEESIDDDDEVALGVQVKLRASAGELVFWWLQGTDNVLFESFCGMLKRELSNVHQQAVNALC